MILPDKWGGGGIAGVVNGLALSLLAGSVARALFICAAVTAEHGAADTKAWAAVVTTLAGMLVASLAAALALVTIANAAIIAAHAIAGPQAGCGSDVVPPNRAEDR